MSDFNKILAKHETLCGTCSHVNVVWYEIVIKKCEYGERVLHLDRMTYTLEGEPLCFLKAIEVIKVDFEVIIPDQFPSAYISPPRLNPIKKPNSSHLHSLFAPAILHYSNGGNVEKWWLEDGSVLTLSHYP